MPKVIHTNTFKESYLIPISEVDRGKYGKNPRVSVDLYNDHGQLQQEIVPVIKDEDDENNVIQITVVTSKKQGQITIG